MVVPARVVSVEANRVRLNRSCRKTTPIITANTVLVSRSAETIATGAKVNAQMATQEEAKLIMPEMVPFRSVRPRATLP